MDMNRLIPKIGSAIVTVTVFLFALFLIIGFSFGYFFVCAILPIGFIIMTAGFYHEADEDRKVPAVIGIALSAVYCVLILLVYFAQITTVRTSDLNEEASRIIDFSKGGLIFNYDLLGYGMMALSTFFTGLAFRAKNKPDKWLKALLMIHGLFFPGCFIMPMTGMFEKMSDGGTSSGGVIALVCWCVYFLPIGILAFLHFGRKEKE
ncbi:MAG: hypothetical protein IKO44_02885 [Ruminococcus sp.]|nr:hypothetical protein [Ruminococcus sp.]